MKELKTKKVSMCLGKSLCWNLQILFKVPKM